MVLLAAVIAIPAFATLRCRTRQRGERRRRNRKRGRPPAKANPAARAAPSPSAGTPAEQKAALAPTVKTKETVQADVWTRSVAITFELTGTEIVVLGP